MPIGTTSTVAVDGLQHTPCGDTRDGVVARTAAEDHRDSRLAVLIGHGSPTLSPGSGAAWRSVEEGATLAAVRRHRSRDLVADDEMERVGCSRLTGLRVPEPHPVTKLESVCSGPDQRGLHLAGALHGAQRESFGVRRHGQPVGSCGAGSDPPATRCCDHAGGRTACDVEGEEGRRDRREVAVAVEQGGAKSPEPAATSVTVCSATVVSMFRSTSVDELEVGDLPHGCDDARAAGCDLWTESFFIAATAGACQALPRGWSVCPATCPS